MNFIRNQNFRAGSKASLEGLVCPPQRPNQSKSRVFSQSGGAVSYILHPKKLLSDLMASNWKIGFIKRLTRLSFSDKIYLALMRLK